ncbi:uncharacterized protein LOC141902095 [Tubulanus polymorphus]|uniref:uncharacterized protein LOC141902095 n=1 Tax=Tubulanus polymorphus TaxID=672921 RepID=UPI003DA1F330
MSKEDVEKEEKTENLYKENYFDMLAKLSNLEAKVYKKEKSDQLQQILGTLTQKKREIQIPIFKGELDQFESWVELVEAEVEKPGYSDVEKAHLVKTLVDGDAKKLVLALRDPTYDNIMKALDNKYGDVHTRLQKAIVDISAIEPAMTLSVKDLDPLYTKLLSCWNYLMKKTESDVHLIKSSWVLTSLVRPKLPKSLVRKWESDSLRNEKRDENNDGEQSTDEYTTSNLPMRFDHMFNKIQDALTVARRSDGEKGGGGKLHVEKRFQPRRSSTTATGHPLQISKSTEESDDNAKTCIFCSKPHSPWLCDDMKKMSVTERADCVKRSNACFNCLKRGRNARQCHSKMRCRKCKKRHCDILHRETSRNEHEKKQSTDSRSNESNLADDNDDEVTKVKGACGLVKVVQGPKKIVMQSGLVNLISKSSEITGRCLFDTGSDVSFIRTAAAKQLNLQGPKVDAEFTLAGGQSMKIKTQKVKLHVSSIIPDWDGEVFEVVAYVLDKPCADLGSVDVDISTIPKFKNLLFADKFPRGEASVHILLGIEDTLRIMMDCSIKDDDGALVAQKSHVGWILSGPCSINSDSRIIEEKYPFCRVDITDPTEIAVKHWELEHIDGRYETGLLKHPDWKDRKLKSNRVIAENRLYGIERRLKGDPELASQYKEQIDDLILSGRAELVIEDEEPTDGRTVWYLPHHPVLKKSSTTTKTRIVNDGASKGPEGISINDTLIPGPALQPDILAILIRFRQHKVALIAEKMFHQIGINERDRDSLRFLWRDLKTDEPPKIYRMTRVVFGI